MPTRPKWPVSLVMAALVAGLVVGVYVDSLGNWYTFDDYIVITANPHARTWPGWDAFVSRRYFKISNELSYRPLVTLTYYFDYLILNNGRAVGRARAHHTTNVLLHAGAAVLVFYLLLTLGLKRPTAFVAAAIFAVHPIASEAVNGIGFREDILALAFCTGALLARAAALRSRGAARAASFALMALCAAMGLLCKETAILLPVLAFLCDHFSGRPTSAPKPRWASIAALGALSAAFAVIRFGLLRNQLEISLPLWSGDRFHAFLGSCHIITGYARLVLFPFGLTLEHIPPTGGELNAAQALGGLAFIAGIVALAVVWARRWPPGAFALAWAALWLLPVCNMVPIANPMAERYLYAPLLGCALIMAAALRHPSLPRRVRELLCLLIIVCFAALTTQRNADWRSDWALHRAAIRIDPRSHRAHDSLGVVYEDMAPRDDRAAFGALAKTQFRLAISADTNDRYALHNLGRMLLRERRYREALPLLRRAVDILERRKDAFPWTFSSFHHDLGVCYWNLKRRLNALRHIQIAVEKNPANRTARENLDKINRHLRKATSER